MVLQPDAAGVLEETERARRALILQKDHLERRGPRDGLSFLIVVRMLVAPLPVIPLSSGVLSVVPAIGPVN